MSGSRGGVGKNIVEGVLDQMSGSPGQVYIEFTNTEAAVRFAENCIGKEQPFLLVDGDGLENLSNGISMSVVGIVNPDLDHQSFGPQRRRAYVAFLATRAKVFEEHSSASDVVPTLTAQGDVQPGA